jgi:hypothetical protein
MTPEKSIERSVDTLQRIYAIIVALAVNEGIKRVFLKGGAADLEVHTDHIPHFITFLFTAVPFVHGMNRHLDKTLTIIAEDKKPKLFKVLVFDFAIFLIESCVLFLLAASVMSDIFFFRLWMTLLVIDLIWSFITWPITKTVVLGWASVNIIAVILSIITIYFSDWLDQAIKIWVLTSIAVLRTVFDYIFAWSFYFPQDVAKPEPPVAAETAGTTLEG